MSERLGNAQDLKNIATDAYKNVWTKFPKPIQPNINSFVQKIAINTPFRLTRFVIHPDIDEINRLPLEQGVANVEEDFQTNKAAYTDSETLETQFHRNIFNLPEQALRRVVYHQAAVYYQYDRPVIHYSDYSEYERKTISKILSAFLPHVPIEQTELHESGFNKNLMHRGYLISAIQPNFPYQCPLESIHYIDTIFPTLFEMFTQQILKYGSIEAFEKALFAGEVKADVYNPMATPDFEDKVYQMAQAVRSWKFFLAFGSADIDYVMQIFRRITNGDDKIAARIISNLHYTITQDEGMIRKYNSSNPA